MSVESPRGIHFEGANAPEHCPPLPHGRLPLPHGRLPLVPRIRFRRTMCSKRDPGPSLKSWIRGPRTANKEFRLTDRQTATYAKGLSDRNPCSRFSGHESHFRGQQCVQKLQAILEGSSIDRTGLRNRARLLRIPAAKWARPGRRGEYLQQSGPVRAGGSAHSADRALGSAERVGASPTKGDPSGNVPLPYILGIVPGRTLAALKAVTAFCDFQSGEHLGSSVILCADAFRPWWHARRRRRFAAPLGSAFRAIQAEYNKTSKRSADA